MGILDLPKYTTWTLDSQVCLIKWSTTPFKKKKNWSETPQTKWHQCLPKTIKLDKWLKSSWIFENAEVMACNWCFRKILGVLNMHFATFCHFLKIIGLPKAKVFGRSQRFPLSGFCLQPLKFLDKYSAFNLSLKHTFCNFCCFLKSDFQQRMTKAVFFTIGWSKPSVLK